MFSLLWAKQAVEQTIELSYLEHNNANVTLKYCICKKRKITTCITMNNKTTILFSKKYFSMKYDDFEVRNACGSGGIPGHIRLTLNPNTNDPPMGWYDYQWYILYGGPYGKNSSPCFESRTREKKSERFAKWEYHYRYIEFTYPPVLL